MIVEYDMLHVMNFSENWKYVPRRKHLLLKVPTLSQIKTPRD